MRGELPPAPDTVSPLNTRATAAVERALDERQREATEEVERILAAAVRVMERVAPEPPRVSDIVSEAGSSNKAFYRYFAGKEDLILAVMERSVAVVASHLHHRMAKERRAQDQVARWIEGALAQAADPQLVGMGSGAVGQLPAGPGWWAADRETTLPLRQLLVEPVAALGSCDVDRDVDAIFGCTAYTVRRYVASAEQPGPDDIAHVVQFCLRGLGVN